MFKLLLFITLILQWPGTICAQDQFLLDGKLRELDLLISNIESSTLNQITPSTSYGQDYQEISKRLSERIQTGISVFRNNLLAIKELAEIILSKEYSELTSIEKKYQQRPSENNNKLLVLKKEQLQQAKRNLQQEINRMYSSALIKLMLLDGHLVWPVEYEKGFDKATRVNILTATAATSFVGFAALGGAIGYSFDHDGFGTILGGVIGIASAAIISGTVAIILSNMKKKSHYADVIGNDDYTEKLVDYNETLKNRQLEAITSIYDLCQSANCIFQHSEDLKEWFYLVLTLNRNQTLEYDLELQKLTLSPLDKIYSFIDEIRNIALETVPLSFQMQ